MRLPWWRMILSAGLLVATFGLWARSFFATDGVYWHVERRPHHVSSMFPVAQDEYTGLELTPNGILIGAVRRGAPNAPGYTASSGWMREPYTIAPLGSVAPPTTLTMFGQRGTFATRDAQDWVVRIPFWFLGVGAILGLHVGLVRPLKAARRAAMAGRCERCGYDLRATPDRCPECGAAPRADLAQQPATATVGNGPD